MIIIEFDINILKALSDDNRIQIIDLLLERDYCVRALSNKLNISESAVSQHLKILREADVVFGEKEGYFVHYRVKIDVITNTFKGFEAFLNKSRKSQCVKNNCSKGGKNNEKL